MLSILSRSQQTPWHILKLIPCLIFLSLNITYANNPSAESPQALKLNHETHRFQNPWGLSFIDEQQLLLSQRSGEIIYIKLNPAQNRILETKTIQQNQTLPLFIKGQGGLLDIAPSPNFKQDSFVYVTYSYQHSNNTASTALARARLDLQQNRLSAWQPLFISNAAESGGRHFGSRITFDQQGHIFFSIGDRGERDHGQNLKSQAAVIMRLKLDGTIPKDNPFIELEGSQAIYSYGHRNPQGLFYDTASQTLFASEHGPRGGDEVNIIEKGANYGWPKISQGKEYWGPFAVGEASSMDGYQDPIHSYTPSIGTSAIAKRANKLWVAALAKPQISELTLDEQHRVISHQSHFSDLKERIRSLSLSPKGQLLFITDNGNLYKSEL